MTCKCWRIFTHLNSALDDTNTTKEDQAMELTQHLEEIRSGIKAGRFPNEASVSQGIVLRLLMALGWPTWDTQVVWPEYALEGRRVDFALCHPSTIKGDVGSKAI